MNTNRKTIVPDYNRAGALDKVSYDGAVYVENIAYNAKGQRLLIAFGNGMMTRYAYDEKTFRLLRQKTEGYTKSQLGNTVTYAYNSGTTRQDDSFNYDLVGNILKIMKRVTDCGIGATPDELDRNFTYDPLYRLLSATGRESDTQSQNNYLYSDAPAPGVPHADNSRAYTRNYRYDKLGNVLQVKQTASLNSFTRNFNYNSGVNTLAEVEDGSAATIQNFTYDLCGNQVTAGATRNYEWTAANRLLVYYNQAGTADPSIYAQYDYDGSGNRVSKLIRTGTALSPVWERVIYIDGVFEYHKLENALTYDKNYVQIMDDKSRICEVRVTSPGMVYPGDIVDSVTYILEDQIGSSVARLNTSGGIIDIEEYYPFGDSSLRSFIMKRYRYVGKEKDAESGLYYYGARYYAAWTCRFISVDPLAPEYPQLTPFNNANNNSINDFDIDGQQDNNTEKIGQNHANQHLKKSNGQPSKDPKDAYVLPTVTVKPEESNLTLGEATKTAKEVHGHGTELKEEAEQIDIDKKISRAREENMREGKAQDSHFKERNVEPYKDAEIKKQQGLDPNRNKGGMIQERKWTTRWEGKYDGGKVKVLKDIKAGVKAALPIDDLFTLAEVLRGRETPFALIFPLAPVFEEQFSEWDKTLFNEAIKQGYEAVKNQITYSHIDKRLGVGFIYVTPDEAAKIMAGDITQRSQLENEHLGEAAGIAILVENFGENRINPIFMFNIVR